MIEEIYKLVLDAIPEEPNAISRRNIARQLDISEHSLDNILTKLKRNDLIMTRELTQKEQRIGRFFDKAIKRGYYKKGEKDV